MPAAAPAGALGGAAPFIIGVAVVVVVGLCLWLLFKTYYNLRSSAASVTVRLYGKAPVTFTLERKGWAFGTYAAIPATFTFTPAAPGCAAPQPTSASSTAAAPASIDVVGASIGSNSISVSAARRRTTVTASNSATVTE